jgi:beta-N-acetylhexosaminidase
MLIMGFSGTHLDADSPLREWLNHGLGGVLLFDYDLVNQVQGKNLCNEDQIKQLITQIKSCSGTNAPFIAIDYEGGAVDRLKHIEGCPATQKPIDLAALSEDAFQAEVTQMANTLKRLGFNLNFAPLVDLNLNTQQGIIGSLGRSFSADPQEVKRIAKRFVEILAAQGITCCYKHFPGHGSATGDTHSGFVDVTDTFISKELVPYVELRSEPKLPVMVMTAHVVNRNLDASGVPATLSKLILTGLLRQEIGYDGVIVSDDLQMQAISLHYSLEEALCLTINAGADMVIFANQLDSIDCKEIVDTIETLVHTGRIDQSRIEQAYQRILRLKQQHVMLA